MSWWVKRSIMSNGCRIDIRASLVMYNISDHGDNFVNTPSLSETKLYCNVVSHWLGTSTKLSLEHVQGFSQWGQTLHQIMWLMGARSKPMREDVTWIMSSFIGWDLAHMILTCNIFSDWLKPWSHDLSLYTENKSKSKYFTAWCALTRATISGAREPESVV